MASPIRTTSAENSDVSTFMRPKNRSSSSSNTIVRDLPTPKSLLSKGRKQALSDVANSSAKISGTRVYGSASGGNIDCFHPVIKNVSSNGSISNEMLESRKTIEARSAKAKTCLKVDSNREQPAKVERLSSEVETMSLYNDYADDYDILPKEDRLSAHMLLNLRGHCRASNARTGSDVVQEGDMFSPPPSPPGVESFVTGLPNAAPSSPDWNEYLVPALEDVVEEEEGDSEIESMFPQVDDDYLDILPKEERLTEKDMKVLRSLRGHLACPPPSNVSLTPPVCFPILYVTPPCYEEFMFDLETLEEPLEPVPLD
ncbi:uncharacterized protein LOC135397368 [Ornithodoros turicata]|uniref:uncharacterized protein LOC135397368 n=1 Tax=Ornithodoros turicata TaxID=34597 RepID=UPI003138DC7F